MTDYNSDFWDGLIEDNCIMFWINETTCIALTVTNVVPEVR